MGCKFIIHNSKRGGLMRWLIPTMMVAGLLVAQPPNEILSEQKREEIMEFIEKYAGPERIRRLNELRLRKPEEYRRHLKRAMMRKRDLERLKEKEPELYEKSLQILELRRESFELVEKYKDAETDKEKEKIKTELSRVVSEQFDLREEVRGARIKRLEEKITRLKEELAERKKNRDEIIERRIDELIDENDYMRW